MDNQAQVTIIIPNYNNKDLLSDLLISLKLLKTNYELIIVDDGSSDDSVEFIKTNYPDINLIENKENHGFAYTVNRGIKASKTEYVYLLNNDTTVTENSLEEVINIIESNPDIFAVSSKMIQFNDHSLIEDAGDEYTILGWSKKRGYNKQVKKYSDDGEVFSACAGASLYRRDIFSKIGLFDENFGSYVEDMDISIRARLHGYKLYYSSNSIIYHYGSATSGSRYNPFKIEISARNNVFLIYKNMSLWMKIINFIFIIFGILIKYLFFLKKGYGNYYLKGVREGFKDRNTLTKTTNISFKRYVQLEILLIINTFRYLL